MKSNRNMREALKKLLQKPLKAIDRRLDEDDVPDEYKLQKSEIDLKEQEIEEMLQASEELIVEINSVNTTLEAMMPVQVSVDKSFSKRLENVANSIIKIKDECERTYEDFKAKMTVEGVNQQPVSYKKEKEIEDTFSSEARIGLAERYYQLTCQLREKKEEEPEQLEEGYLHIAQHLDEGKKFEATYEIAKGLSL